MKKFLWVDGSGRGFSAEWSEDEIRADIEDGAAGVFYEYDQPDEDGTGAEPISEWLDRCNAGDEYNLDAARLVCMGDDCTTIRAGIDTPARFSLTIETSGAAFDGDEPRAVAAILRDVAARLDEGAGCGRSGAVRDVNGNTVGRWEFD